VADVAGSCCLCYGLTSEDSCRICRAEMDAGEVWCWYDPVTNQSETTFPTRMQAIKGARERFQPGLDRLIGKNIIVARLEDISQSHGLVAFKKYEEVRLE
jgi:hypothetical protein